MDRDEACRERDMASIKRLIRETRRRHVFRVVASYVVAGWLLLQVADLAFGCWMMMMKFHMGN